MKTLPITAEQQAELVVWRAEALELMPYMASILLNLRPVNAPGLGTFACDQHYRLYIDFDAVSKMSPQFCAQALLHECAHLFAHDAERAEEHGVPRNGRMTFNVAADCANNDDLIDAGCTALAEHAMQPSTIGADKYQTAEFYYDHLKDLEESDPQSGDDKSQGGGEGDSDGDGNASPSWGGCGSASGGESAPCELDEENDLDGHAPAATSGEKQIHDISVASDIRDRASKQPGSVPGGLVERASQILKPAEVNWRTVLSRCVRRSVASRNGEYDVTYSRRSRRLGYIPYGNGRVVRPGSESPIPNLVVVRDTSGSMGEVELQVVTNEVEGIAKQLGIRDENLVVLDVDVIVQATRKYRRAEDLAVVAGRGGTDMAKGILQASELRPTPSAIVVITDGATGWPDEPIRIPVVACIVGNTEYTSRWETPPWIKRVDVDLAK
jgi:predicted metal-dependent peptidase